MKIKVKTSEGEKFNKAVGMCSSHQPSQELHYILRHRFHLAKRCLKSLPDNQGLLLPNMFPGQLRRVSSNSCLLK